MQGDPFTHPARSRSTMSASDVNRSPAIGHARPPGQSADWPHDAPSMTLADAVSSAKRPGSSVAPRHGAHSLRAEGGASLRIVRAGSVTEVSSSQSSRSRKGMGGTRRSAPGCQRALTRPQRLLTGAIGRCSPIGRSAEIFHAKDHRLVKTTTWPAGRSGRPLPREVGGTCGERVDESSPWWRSSVESAVERPITIRPPSQK